MNKKTLSEQSKKYAGNRKSRREQARKDNKAAGKHRAWLKEIMDRKHKVSVS